MAVIKVGLDRTSAVEESLEDYVINWNAVASFNVETDGNATSIDILNSPLSPKIGSIFVEQNSSNQFLKCVKRSPQQQEGTSLWKLVCTYETLNSSFVTDNPLMQPAVPSWDTVTYQQSIDIDLDGKAVLLPNGRPFSNPAVIRDRRRPILRIVQNEASYNKADFDQVIDNINTDKFLGFDAYTVKVASIMPSEPITDPQVGTFWQIEYVFEMNPDGWKAEPLFCDTQQLDDDGNLVPIYIENQQTSEPQLLDANGKAIPPGPNANDLAQFGDFRIYQEIAFNGLFNFRMLDLGKGPGKY